MQYTITINQLAVISSGLNLDVVDMSIFDFIKHYAHSDRCMKLQTETGVSKICGIRSIQYRQCGEQLQRPFLICRYISTNQISPTKIPVILYWNWYAMIIVLAKSGNY